MSRIDDWRARIEPALSELARGLTNEPQLDLGLVATGVLWPIRQDVVAQDATALAAMREVVGDDSALVAQLIRAWPADVSPAAAQTTAAAREQPALQLALVRAVSFFDAFSLLTTAIVQCYAPAPGTTNSFGDIRAALLSIGGTVHIQSLTVQLPVDEVAQAQRRLNEAIALLQQLPTAPEQPVPPVAPLPTPNRMPLAENPLFVGRAADLRELAAALKAGTTTVIAAATGMGGVGKTQLASEFAHRYGQYFAGGVFWLSFATAGGVEAEIAACGAMMGLPGFDGLELAEQVARVRQAWQAALPRLLVFDNCEDEALLRAYRPTSGGWRCWRGPRASRCCGSSGRMCRPTTPTWTRSRLRWATCRWRCTWPGVTCSATRRRRRPGSISPSCRARRCRCWQSAWRSLPKRRRRTTWTWRAPLRRATSGWRMMIRSTGWRGRCWRGRRISRRVRRSRATC